MMEDVANYSHQQALFEPNHAKKVTIIGAGMCGSMVAFTLAKMGVREIEVWDHDVISSHNSPMSLYGPTHLGRSKVKVLREILLFLTGTEISAVDATYEGQPLKNTSVVSCVDRMSERKVIWNAIKFHPTVDLFCDTRTNAWYAEVLCVKPYDDTDIQSYEALLYPDENASRQVCGMHGVMPVALFAAHAVSANLARYWQEGTREWRVSERCDTLKRVF